jgi:MFS family permease
VAFFTIDRFGRRKLFVFSGFGMSMCMTALAITNSFPTSNHAAQYASVFFVFFFNFFVPIGFLGCNYLYVTEVAPTRLRSKFCQYTYLDSSRSSFLTNDAVPMASFSTANHWLWNFAVLMITPVAINELGYQYYILYAVLGACIPIMVFFLFPETMGRSLDDMERLFKDHDSIAGVVKASLTPIDPEIARLAEVAARKEFDNKPYAESIQVEKRA